MIKYILHEVSLSITHMRCECERIYENLFISLPLFRQVVVPFLLSNSDVGMLYLHGLQRVRAAACLRGEAI